MGRLLKIELIKVLYYRTCWVMMGLYAILLFFAFFGAGGLELKLKHQSFNLGALAIYDFPNIWHNLTYLASYFHWILGIMVIILVANETKFNTFRQHIIEGLTRFQLLIGKLQLIVLISLITTIILFIIGLTTGLIYSNSKNFTLVVSKMGYLASFLVQAICFMSMAFLFGLLFRRAGIAVVLYLLYIIAIEPMIGYTLIKEVRAYLPAELFNSIIVFPYSSMWGKSVPSTAFTPSFWVGIGYTLVMWSGSYLIIWWTDW